MNEFWLSHLPKGASVPSSANAPRKEESKGEQKQLALKLPTPTSNHCEALVPSLDQWEVIQKLRQTTQFNSTTQCAIIPQPIYNWCVKAHLGCRVCTVHIFFFIEFKTFFPATSWLKKNDNHKKNSLEVGVHPIQYVLHFIQGVPPLYIPYWLRWVQLNLNNQATSQSTSHV